MPKIRIATELDLFWLVQLAKTYVEEADRWGNLTFDPERAVKYAALAIEDKDQQIFIAVEEGEIVGFIWVTIMGQVWTADPIARDLFLYVHPEHRNASVAIGLVVAFEKWAEACGAKAIHVGANSGINEDKAASGLYRHLGYEPGGANFYKTL